MEIRLETVLGTAEIGLFAVPTDKYVLVSKHVNPSKRKVFETVLDVQSVAVSISDSILLSPFAVGNSTGLIVSSLILEEELQKIKQHLPDVNISKLNSKYTAVGNLILCNDKGALVSSVLGKSAVKVVEDVLGVEASPGLIAGRSYLGSLAVATNYGALVYIEAEEDDVELVKNVLKVDVELGTVNGGVKFPRSSLVANSKGVLVGSRTTGPELLTISKIFLR